jgi:hypothetical protein
VSFIKNTDNCPDLVPLKYSTEIVEILHLSESFHNFGFEETAECLIDVVYELLEMISSKPKGKTPPIQQEAILFAAFPLSGPSPHLPAAA